MMPGIVKRSEKVIEVDESVTKIVFKNAVQAVKIEDEETSKAYRIQRTPVKRGLQMTGA